MLQSRLAQAVARAGPQRRLASNSSKHAKDHHHHEGPIHFENYRREDVSPVQFHFH